MTDFNFKKWNNILAWVAFAIAFVTYALTIEPTVSFWDAGEYILTSSKLQVGHPPGAPLFQMMGAFFSMFALEPSQIGMIMNMMSATASAFTILFMFWTISLLLTKLVNYKKDSNSGKAIAILGSALVGSLAFAFTDSFWFNAVETEVYAMATLIMAVMFYLALRWEKEMHTPRGNRWLILIAFIIGLSFGVHFMGLLTIPAIGLIYYFKNYKTITIKNFIIANIASAAILLFIFKLLLPSTLKLFGYLEVFFVNSIGLPFNSGTIITGLMVIALFYLGLNYTRKKGMIHANTLVLSLMFIFIGFSSWMMLPIRANAQVIINENDPSDARELLAYYNLEQYPETHLFYGPQFTEIYSGSDKDEPFVDDKKNYERDDKLGEYVIINDWEGSKQNYNHEHASILPRMWSSEHADNYMMFTGFIDFKIDPNLQRRAYNEAISYGLSEDEAGQYALQEKQRFDKVVNDFRIRISKGEVDYEAYDKFLRTYGQQYLIVEQPSFFDNLGYMFQYQFGYMYWRYFMWNFTGRQNDIQGKYDDFNGNWISGIKFIDERHLGVSQNDLPTEVLENKARNTYYFLPLLLGLVGFFFLMYKDAKRFWVMLVFFLLTGLAIQFYTNIRPFEPRERDYSVVGSFYVFAIWIGFGVYAIYDRLLNNIKNNFKYLTQVIVGTAICILLFLMFNYIEGIVENSFLSIITSALSTLFLIVSAVAITLAFIDILTFLIFNSIKNKNLSVVSIIVVCLVVPSILAANNWDDHDRSGKYTANAMARKYLESCAPNAILFTIGDNDSFPLWYLQEIEGVRTDVRVVNTSLFQTDWYIDQMKRKAYESDPIPSQLTHNQYRGGTRDVIVRGEITKDTIPIQTFMDFVSSEKPTTKFKNYLEKTGEDPRQYPSHFLNTNYFPTRHISIPVNKEEVLNNGIVKPKDADKIEDNLYATIEGSYIYKNRLLMLDIIANNNWERPIYFTGGAFGADDYVWLKDYLQLDGMCYKLVPIKTPVDRANPYDMGRVDADLMYNMVKDWNWGGSGEDIYYDIETRRNGITYRGNLARLMEALINEDKLDKAEEIADIAMEKMPVDKFGFHSLLEPYISGYYEVGNIEKARTLYKDVTKVYQENIVYFSGLDEEDQIRLIEDIYLDIQRYRALVDILVIYNDKDFALEETKKFNSYLSLLDKLMGPVEEELEPREDIDINSILNDSLQGSITPEE